MKKTDIEKKIEELLVAMKSPNYRVILTSIIETIYNEGYEDGQNNPDMDDIREGMAESAQFRRDSID